MVRYTPSGVKQLELYRLAIMGYGSLAFIIVSLALLRIKNSKKFPNKEWNSISAQFNYMLEENKDKKEKWTSRIPKHLSKEEREKWEKDLAWETQERERRKKEGQYPSEESSGSRKIILKRSQNGKSK